VRLAGTGEKGNQYWRGHRRCHSRIQNETGPADYILFVDKKPVGNIEAKREDEGVRLTMVEDQSVEYATSKLKYLKNEPLPFV